MSISMMIYLINVASALKATSTFIIASFIIVLIGCIILLPIIIDNFYDKDLKNYYLYKMRYIIIFILALSVIINIVIPSKNDMYIILGLSVAETVITSDKGNALFNKSYQLIIDKIDEATLEQKKEDTE